ncbi:MAG: enoyl-CoA hydratase/isomerase family protein, partial [Thermoleophilia bacterium]|nr:enoyl-CoA hydratase/isomerase family protein [Thermoleophilia bacterium]
MSVRCERDGAILVVTIDRPEARTALSPEMSRRLAAAWIELRDDPELRVAVLTGAGAEAFCAGADLKQVGAWYRSMTPLERRRHGEREPGLGGLTRNLDPGKPVLAAVNGAC